MRLEEEMRRERIAFLAIQGWARRGNCHRFRSAQNIGLSKLKDIDSQEYNSPLNPSIETGKLLHCNAL